MKPCNRSWRSLALPALRWTIAIVGLSLVLRGVSWHDHVILRNGMGQVRARLASPASDRNSEFHVIDPHSGAIRVVDRSMLVQRPGYPLVEVGLHHMVRQARPGELAAALLVYVVCLLLTTWRWKELLAAQGIGLSYSRTFGLNMLGNFYNTFMPGSVGGDVFKAYYAARQTPHRAAAVLSVLLDRILGLIGLVLLGGTAAAWLYVHSAGGDRSRAVSRIEAIAAAAVLAGCLIAWVVLRHPAWRRWLMPDAFLERLPLGRQIRSVMFAMRTYAQRPRLLLWAVLISLPVHITVVISAILAGKALGLPLSIGYYLVVVPAIVLAGVLPLTPQGVGVMELVAVALTAREGATVAQAFALAMAIRMVPLLWSLGGGVLLLWGVPGTHRPEESQATSTTDPAHIANLEGTQQILSVHTPPPPCLEGGGTPGVSS